mgnify:CR=1 FL=1
MRKTDSPVIRDGDRLGTVQGHRDGFGFVVPDDGGEDIFLAEREMARVMHGDRVSIRVLGTDRRGRPDRSSPRAPAAARGRRRGGAQLDAHGEPRRQHRHRRDIITLVIIIIDYRHDRRCHHFWLLAIIRIRMV